MLTSTKNQRIQHIRKLQRNAQTRRAEQCFVVEGVRLVEEALNFDWQPKYVIYTEDITNRGRKIIEQFQRENIETLLVSPHVLEAASDTQNPQGILAVLPIKSIAVPQNPKIFLILDGMRDPGNLGTILRTALAAGIDAVLLLPGTVDPFSPKVMRSGMGAHFKLPIHSMGWDAIQNLVDSLQLNLYLADSSSGESIYATRFTSPCAIIIGGEADGAGDQSHQLAIHKIHIPMPGQAESLNAAIAAALLMFEFVRQQQ